ncbi:MAG: hypothetical protein KDA72_23205, partial [Planctomycetales bacterium]|nr:hypothetical protein [Planctomycetales bacterium]
SLGFQPGNLKHPAHRSLGFQPGNLKHPAHRSLSAATPLISCLIAQATSVTVGSVSLKGVHGLQFGVYHRIFLAVPLRFRSRVQEF